MRLRGWPTTAGFGSFMTGTPDSSISTTSNVFPHAAPIQLKFEGDRRIHDTWQPWAKSMTYGKIRLDIHVAKAALAVPELAAKRRPGPRILIYHQVGTNLGREMEIATEAFADQIRYLEAEGTIVSLNDAIARMGTPDDDRLFVLTFDDGYADMHANAFPLLRDRRIPFTLYITTLPIEDSTATQPGASPLTWEHLEEMVESGLATIGAHTHSHPDLRFLSADAVAAELDESNALIFDRLGVHG